MNPLAESFPPLSAQEAIVEANRCLFCYDAPCTQACPTHIDIPRFIKKIATDNLAGSARAIFESNLLGATCARVCPVQELCEGACVLGAEHRPITIGRLQRYSMDYAYARKLDPFPTPPKAPGSIAVIGAGPAGLSCAGELARVGYAVTIFEKRPLAGGLSTYGIITLREPVEASLAEVEMIARLGVRIETEVEAASLAELRERFDAVFLAIGMGSTPELGIANEELVEDGLAYIEQSKLAPQNLRVGQNVVVIGAGNTAIDCATIAKRLGAERVTMIYRRTQNEMTAYRHEYEFVKKEGVDFRFLTQPVRVLADGGKVNGLECLRMALGEPDSSGRPSPKPVRGSQFIVDADQIVRATGQHALSFGLASNAGKINVDASLETSVPGVYAGGDCIRVKGAASTVMAVQDGKLAAQAIHDRLKVSSPNG
jgi:glutamate synthase (NADPH/NADH) small chain